MKRTFLNSDNDESKPIDAFMANQAAVALARYACNGCTGRLSHDPVFIEVTEHRQATWTAQGKLHSYSACADLAHWVLWNLVGKPAPTPAVKAQLRGINRKEAFGWQVGLNIALLAHHVAPRVKYGPGVKFTAEPGHILLIGEGGQEHIAIVKGIVGPELYTFDYGQFFALRPHTAADYGGRCVTRDISGGKDGRPWVHGHDGGVGRPIVMSIDTGKFVAFTSTVVRLPSTYVPE